MSKFKTILVSLLVMVAFVSLTLLSGCPAPQRRPAPPPPNATPGPAPGVNPGPGGPRTAPGPVEPAPAGPQDGVQEGRRLATMINALPEVNSSSVIISGNRAIVGVDLKADLTIQRVKAVKAEVSRRVKRANDNITNVSVTADADTVTRIKRVADGLTQGRPLSSFANEMAEITQRLNPTNR